MNAAQMTASTIPPPPPEEYPACCCSPPVPWPRRRLDAPTPFDPALESRTCLTCGATRSIAYCEVYDRTTKCEERAHWYVTPTRKGEPYHACERHTYEALHHTFCEVEDVNGDPVHATIDGDLVSS